MSTYEYIFLKTDASPDAAGEELARALGMELLRDRKGVVVWAPGFGGLPGAWAAEVPATHHRRPPGRAALALSAGEQARTAFLVESVRYRGDTVRWRQGGRWCLLRNAATPSCAPSWRRGRRPWPGW